MKKWILSVSLLAGAVGLAGCGAGGDTVATSSAGDVTQEELYEAMKEQFTPQMEQTLQELMYRKVLSDKYKVTEEELDQEMKQTKEQLGDQYDMFLSQYGLDEEAFKDMMELQLLQEKAVLSEVEVTDQEVKDYYKEWQPPVKVRHILVEDEKTAQDIKNQLANGAKFADLAKEHSTDTASAQNGGDLGWIDYANRQQFVPEFTEQLNKLEKGQVSDPVKSDFGYHIIEVTDKQEKKPLEEIKEELTEELKLSKVDAETLQNTLNKELKAADVKVEDESLEGAFSDLSESNKEADTNAQPTEETNTDEAKDEQPKEEKPAE